MAYVDQDQQSEQASQPVTPTSNKSLYAAMKSAKGKQPTTDYSYSNLIKIVLTCIAVVIYIRPIAQISSTFAIYEMLVLLCFGLTGACMARYKRNSINGFLLGVLLCPFGLIMAAYLKDRTRTPCNHCAENIKTDAMICPFCKTNLNE